MMSDIVPTYSENRSFEEAVIRKSAGMKAFLSRKGRLSESVVLASGGKYCERVVRCVGGDHLVRAQSYVERYNSL